MYLYYPATRAFIWQVVLGTWVSVSKFCIHFPFLLRMLTTPKILILIHQV